MGPKRLKIANATFCSTDWTKCFLCRNIGGEIQNPSLNKDRSKREAGYKTIAENLLEFQSFDELPQDIDLSTLDEGDGLESTLIANSACWHKSCFNKYNKKNVNRARERYRKKLFQMESKTVILDNDSNGEINEPTTTHFTRAVATHIDLKSEVCFLCDCGPKWNDSLRTVSTFEMDKRVRRVAQLLGESKLLATLGSTDLIAQEAKYHIHCLVDLYNRGKNLIKDPNDEPEDSVCEALAFAFLASFIREKLCDTSAELVFKMGLLKEIYKNKLNELHGSEFVTFVHTTRLRERILSHFSQLRAEKSGKEFVLVRNTANMFQDAISENADEDAISFERFIMRLRKEIKKESNQFSGSFEQGCQRKSVPSSLLAVVNYLLYGSSEIKECKATQPALSISQLIIFNYTEKVPSGEIVRHKYIREPPLPIYIALSAYSNSRSKQNIDQMHQLGLSISSKRLTKITSVLSQVVVTRAKEEGILCPSNFRRGLFTVSAYDNIDHNFSSVTSQQSFHGTAISVFQYPLNSDGNEEKDIIKKTLIMEVDTSSTKVPELPDFYSLVKAVVLPNKEPTTYPKYKSTPNTLKITETWHLEKEWLEHNYRHQNINEETYVDLSWAAFHASKSSIPKFVEFRSLLPLFYESSTSVSMVRHGMDVIKATTKFLNEEQQPVIVMDQPLFAVAKLVQWNWPAMYGEDKMFVMFGSFHIEQAFLTVIGDFLEDSGWVSAIANSGIATETAALSSLSAKHVTKARFHHQITACALYALLEDAFRMADLNISFNEWIDQKASISPTFLFWMKALNLEILLLVFVRSIRLGDFQLFKTSLKQMIPWFFVFDHTHYARWLSVHLKDLEELPEKCPSVNFQFNLGNFVIKKTKKPFSALAIDQAHEQHNADVKDSGGAIGIMQDPSALRRWSISGPEITRLIGEFSTNSESHDDRHHEQYEAFQKKFLAKIKVLKESFMEFGNPFFESLEGLVTLDTHIIASEERIKALKTVESMGLKSYNAFVQERLVEGGNLSVFSPLQKHKIKIFAKTKCNISKQTQKISALKNDVNLFAKLFIACQSRNIDLDTFFLYENQAYPPSLSINGEIRSCKKSDLIAILEGVSQKDIVSKRIDFVVYDGAALVNILAPRKSRTFEEYALEFLTEVYKNAENIGTSRLDIVWDMYTGQGIKKATQMKRGSGIRRQVCGNHTLPKNWSDFLRNNQNKDDLFHFLAGKLATLRIAMQVVSHVDTVFVHSGNGNNFTSLTGSFSSDCPEADSRLLLHVQDAVIYGAKTAMIRTVDTDVLVLSVSYFFLLKHLGLQKFWIDFGVGKSRRYIAVHQIALALGENKSVALRGFHSFSGCDTISSFANKGKIKAWRAWQKFDFVTEAFLAISQPIDIVEDTTKDLLEKFVVLLYDTDCLGFSLSQTRKILFSSKNRSAENIPPTSAALVQHILRSAYQSGHIWGQAMEANPTMPSPSEWGWVKSSDIWIPIWSGYPPVSEACRELVTCGCKKKCATRCSCNNAGLVCSLLCKHCKGTCNNEREKTSSSDDSDACDLP